MDSTKHLVGCNCILCNEDAVTVVEGVYNDDTPTSIVIDTVFETAKMSKYIGLFVDCLIARGASDALILAALGDFKIRYERL